MELGDKGFFRVRREAPPSAMARLGAVEARSLSIVESSGSESDRRLEVPLNIPVWGGLPVSLAAPEAQGKVEINSINAPN